MLPVGKELEVAPCGAHSEHIDGIDAGAHGRIDRRRGEACVLPIGAHPNPHTAITQNTEEIVIEIIGGAEAKAVMIALAAFGGARGGLIIEIALRRNITHHKR